MATQTVITGIHEDDQGTTFVVQFMEDGAVFPVNSAIAKEIRFEKPDGTVEIKTGADITFTTDGADGKIQYYSAVGFLDAEGPWRIQGKATLPGGVWHSEIGFFAVSQNI